MNRQEVRQGRPAPRLLLPLLGKFTVTTSIPLTFLLASAQVTPYFWGWERGCSAFPGLSNQVQGLVLMEFQASGLGSLGWDGGNISEHRSPENMSRISCHLPRDPVAHRLQAQPRAQGRLQN